MGLHSHGLNFDAIFDTIDEGQKARPEKLLKCKIQASRARADLDTTTLNWFNVAQLALQTPVPETLKRPPNGPINWGSYFTGYGTGNLACHYLGVNCALVFVTEKSSVKDTLRIAIAKTCHPQETDGYVL